MEKSKYTFALKLCLVSFVLTPLAVAKADQSAQEILEKLKPIPFSQAVDRVDKLNGRGSMGNCRPIASLANFENDMLCVSSQPYRDLMEKKLANTSTFVIRDVAIENLPGTIKDRLPKSILEGDVKKKVSLTITFGNDNLQMLGFGLIKDPEKKLGDDFFKTTTFGINLKEDQPSNSWLGEGVQIRQGFQSDLYTEQVKGSSQVRNGQTYDQQKSRNVDVLSFFADNIKAGNVLFWDAGVGLISVNSEKGFEKAVSQQKAWHNLLNSVKSNEVAKHTNINEDEKARISAFVSAYLGLQKTFQLSESCSVRGEVKAGGRWAGMGFSNASVSGEVSFTKMFSNGNSITPYIRSTSTLRPDGVGRAVETGATYGWDQGKEAVGVMITRNYGVQEAPPGFNHTKNNFTGKLDSYFMAWYRTTLGR